MCRKKNVTHKTILYGTELRYYPKRLDNRGFWGKGEKAMSHDARAVANEMITRGIENENPLTPLQIIKLTYLCQAWMLGMFGNKIFEQKVEAWEYGPVIADVYHSVKHFVNQPIDETMPAYPARFNDAETHILNEVYRVYGKRSGGALSGHTHKPGTPWHQTKEENPTDRRVEISPERIEEYYKGIIRESKREMSGGL